MQNDEMFVLAEAEQQYKGLRDTGKLLAPSRGGLQGDSPRRNGRLLPYPTSYVVV